MSWPRAVVLALAVGFLGYALALFLNRDGGPPAADSVDVGFYQDMVLHHEQAVEMSQLELVNGADPLVRKFAREILVAQSWEMGVMERTLQEWGYSSADRPAEAMAWMGMPVPAQQMQGLASEDEMEALEQAEGEEADVLFLELMVEHHLGGVHMAEYAGGEAADEDVRELAQRQACHQAVEINEMALAAEDRGLPADLERFDEPPCDG